ncbi:glycosyltransferase [Patescibacteria group bacterium]|nr:glycosyltransferase [Patescibacteria group bacterium]MBU0847640.1 glycosyltransferase [Patescibacteria group bacterium]
MTKILHITPHLGGGVGKILSSLIEQSIISNSYFKHIIVCLEESKKNQFENKIRKCGGKVIIQPSINELEKLIKDADIIQLEWWNHPATIEYLCRMSISPIRLLIWYHNSGLHNPIVPKKLILASHVFLFTSECSLENKEIVNLIPKFNGYSNVVYSSGGFKELPEPNNKDINNNEDILVGYIGSTNFSKLHPEYVNYLSKIDIPNFKVKIIGDVKNKDILNKQCENIGNINLIEFTDYVQDIVSELKNINVLAYILNPKHYGTTENALLESMSMGIVPVVLNNPAEKYIVDNNVNGFIVNSKEEFKNIIKWLYENPIERQKIGKQAAKSVRKRFSIENTESELNIHYQNILQIKKKKIDFLDIFGKTPSEWFLSCQKNKDIFSEDEINYLNNDEFDNYMLFEETKGSVFHFSKYFSHDQKLKKMVRNLDNIKMVHI